MNTTESNSTIDLSDTERPFSIGSNIMIEIVDGTIYQLSFDQAGNKRVLKSFAASSLTTEQAEAITRRRVACAAARKAEGWDK